MSVGDPHATQGDGELGGTAIECPMTRTFQLIPHKKVRCAQQRLVLAGLDLGFEQVVMARIYLTRFQQDFAAMNETYRKLFRARPSARRTCVGVTGLGYDALIEIDLVARRPA